ncbi:hypothetical protein BN11_1080004 [Nostocoides australiense Ben110]|uniref:Uncharacterized protein n=1 Tax=Nostocoides australiense Ben110 TaxID=1193182 RepID=W6K081_9MICO|nr:hypothetical protein BN11_1080004 [Tetrasphaera australiensis Ben110]
MAEGDGRGVPRAGHRLVRSRPFRWHSPAHTRVRGRSGHRDRSRTRLPGRRRPGSLDLGRDLVVSQASAPCRGEPEPGTAPFHHRRDPSGIEDFFRGQRDYLTSGPAGHLPDPQRLAAVPGADLRRVVGPPLTARNERPNRVNIGAVPQAVDACRGAAYFAQIAPYVA